MKRRLLERCYIVGSSSSESTHSIDVGPSTKRCRIDDFVHVDNKQGESVRSKWLQPRSQTHAKQHYGRALAVQMQLLSIIKRNLIALLRYGGNNKISPGPDYNNAGLILKVKFFQKQILREFKALMRLPVVLRNTLWEEVLSLQIGRLTTLVNEYRLTAQKHGHLCLSLVSNEYHCDPYHLHVPTKLVKLDKHVKLALSILKEPFHLHLMLSCMSSDFTEGQFKVYKTVL